MLTLPNLGFNQKVFEVLEWKFGGDTSLGIELTLRETNSSVYNWSTSEQQDPTPTPALTPTYNTVVATPSFSLTQTEEVGVDGTTIPMIEVNITDPVDDKHVNLYLVNYKESTESTYNEISLDREY